jgi:transposase
VKPYVKRQKNDAADAEAICEAVSRANMRFVATKTPEQQSCLMLHRTRHLFIRQQTAVINAIRAHLAEFGIVAPVGRNGVEDLLKVVADPSDRRVPEIARACLASLGAQLRVLKAQILEFDRMINAWHRSNETSKRLDEIPGVGPVLATALIASVADPKTFRSGRDFSAWIGLVPKQRSSGGRDKLGSISKQGDRYLRSLFTAGALAVIRYAKIHGTKHRPWISALLARRPTKVAAIAEWRAASNRYGGRYDSLVITRRAIMKRAVLYLRVSTVDQTTANQERELREIAGRIGCEIVKVYKDHGISGAKGRDKRPAFDALCRDATQRKFDVVMAWSVDRLGRSLQDLIGFLSELHAMGIDLFLHQQGLDTTTPAGKAMFQMLGVFAEFERSMIKERVRAGLARAKAAGTKLGRPSLPQAKEAAIRAALKQPGRPGVRKIAAQFGVDPSTVQRISRPAVS